MPAVLSSRQVTAASTARGITYDVTIGGIGFLLDCSTQTPYERETIDIQKQQIDTSPEAGEQTLEGAWTRSQTSWHLGAGAGFYEPGTRDQVVPSRHRFWASEGVDVWTPGEVSLLRAVDTVATSGLSSAVAGGRVAGADVWWRRVGDVITRHQGASSAAHGATPLPLEGRITVAGRVLLAGSSQGVLSTPVGGGPVTVLAGAPLGAVCEPWWVKSRVVVTRGNELHSVSLTGGSLGAGTLLWAHPDPDWRWSGVTDAPDAVLAAGHSSGSSAVYAFTLTEDGAGAVPKLGQPFEVAALPFGEEIRSILSYLGRYVCLGTTSGIRVAVTGDRASLQVGPLLVSTAAPVAAVTARDSFFYAAAGAQVYRVQLAETIDDGLRFPYAADAALPGAASSLAFDGASGRLVGAATGVGVYAQSKTVFLPSGWVQSGVIRYSSTVPKAFRTIDVDSVTSTTDSVGVSVVVDESLLTLLTLTKGQRGTGIGLGTLPAPLAELSYRLDLAGGVTSPRVRAVAVRAQPVPPRQRLVQYPLILSDKVRDSNQQAYEQDGFATSRLEALEDLESSQQVISVFDRERPERFEAVIERVRFTRVTRSKFDGNFGGVALVTVRTL